MARQFEFAVTRSLNFPTRCICCGGPKEAEVPMNINRLIMQGQKQVQKSVTVDVPLCLRCKHTDQQILLLSIVSFAIGLAGVGLLCVILLTLADARTGILENLGINNIPNQPGAWFTLVCGVSFLLGMISGFVLEALIKVLIIPFVGKALYYAPILAVQMLGDVEYVAGIQGRLSKEAKSLQLRFFNDRVADEFAALNP